MLFLTFFNEFRADFVKTLSTCIEVVERIRLFVRDSRLAKLGL